MSEKDNNPQNDLPENTAPQEDLQQEKPQNGSFWCLYVAIGCFAVGCVLFALSFILTVAIKGAGVYLLIASMILELAAASFLNAQKRKKETTLCKVIKVLSYVVMGAAIIVVVIGMSIVNA